METLLNHWPQVVWVASGLTVLIFLNALFVAAEFSLVKLRYTRIDARLQEMARQKSSIGHLMDQMESSLKFIRLGITVCTILLGFILVPVTSGILGWLGWESGTTRVLAWLIAFTGATAVLYSLGELVPRALGLQYPLQSLQLAMPVLKLFKGLSAPFLRILDAFTARLLLWFSLQPGRGLDTLSVEAQIRSMAQNGEELSPFAEEILQNALKIRKRVGQDVLIPRRQVLYMDLEDTPETNLDLARKSGHTRFPLCEGDLDHCIGIIHIKDLFRYRGDLRHIDLRRLAREVLRFSVDEPLDGILRRFLHQKRHFALLQDEFGGVMGAITLENILEELVGEIQDEFDREEAMIIPLGPDSFQIQGLAPLHDVSDELGIPLDDAEVSTFGGYVTHQLGRMPRPREAIRLGRMHIVVTDLDERRIISARVQLLPEEFPEEE